MLILTSFPFCAADCRSEKRSVFYPILVHVDTRQRARLQPLEMESGHPAVNSSRPSLVYTADHFAHHMAQKHQQEPCYPKDTTDYFKYSIHYELSELIKYDECYHTCSVFFLRSYAKSAKPPSPLVSFYPIPILFPSC